MMRILVTSVALSMMPLAIASAAASASLVRSQSDHSVSVDQHGAGRVAADVRPHSEDVHEAALVDTSNDDPCRSLGCNSNKCSWVSGEMVRRTSTKKSCANAKAVKGLTEGSVIDTLTQCTRAVKKGHVEDKESEPHFQMNMEMNECMCVPVGEKCEEKEHEKVCRFEL